ncbi:MAG: PAS domain S-box protein [Candidatus Omnitrophica bacterium]|nr:PAS domain S-box protein [Candidatus Omnitrophota bacterium]
MEEEIKKLENIILFKETEIKNLKEEVRNLKNIISHFPGIIIVLNKYGIIEFINENGAKILGYSYDELTGENWFEKCIPENIKDSLRFVFNKIIEGEIEEYKYYESPIETKYKTLKIIEWRNIYIKDEKGNIIKIINYGTETSSKGLIKDDIEKKLIKFLDNIPEAIHIIDREYNILYINETFKNWNKILGFESNVIGKKIFDVYPFLTENIKNEYQKVFDTGDILITKEKNLIRDKEIITETRKIPIFEREKVVHILTLIRELTNFLKDL